MFRKEILFCGQVTEISCDGNCSKAWGINNRPRFVPPDAVSEDDYAWLADDELGEAPTNPGTYEGGQGKPIGATGPESMNKWCARECERLQFDGQVRDLSRRRWNMPHRKLLEVLEIPGVRVVHHVHDAVVLEFVAPGSAEAALQAIQEVWPNVASVPLVAEVASTETWEDRSQDEEKK